MGVGNGAATVPQGWAAAGGAEFVAGPFCTY